MATENSELQVVPESDVIDKLDEKSTSEVAGEPRVPLQGDPIDKYIKAEGSDNVKDAGFEFVDYQKVIKQERTSEDNPNTTYPSCENPISEVESDTKYLRVSTDIFKEEVSDSATNRNVEGEAETVPLKAETATSGQDMKVEIETIPIIDSELESASMNGSAEEAAAAKVQPENASAAPKKNMGKKRGNWMPENMKLAVDEVRGGKLSIREASEKFCVPKSTLADRLKLISAGNETNMKPAMGTFKSTFSEEEDDALYNYIKMLDSHLMPLNKNEFLKLVFQYAEYLKLNHQFNKEKGMAGKKFYYSFMNRHPDLSLRLAESTNLKRAKHFNQEPVSEFFDKLTELMCKYSLDPARIYNANEIEVSTLHENQPKVMSVKGNLNSGKRGKKITVLLCINASGDNFVPPLLVFPRVRMDNKLTKDAPMGTIFDAHPWGWITKNGFLKWMKSFVLRVNPSEDNPVLLIVDGHCAHKDLDVILFAQAHNVHMLSLPPHTSHKFQSLDRVIMKPFKTAYNEACSTWMRKYPNLKITLKDISGLISCAFTKVCRMELAQSAFSCFGIYPLNHNIFSDTDLFSSSTELLQTTSEDFSNTQHHQMKTSSEQQTSILCFSALPCTASPLTTKSEHSDSSNQNPSPSVSLIQKLNPLPNEAIQNMNLRKRRGDQNEILSSTPFKQSLGERKQTTILQESNKTTKHYAAKGEI